MTGWRGGPSSALPEGLVYEGAFGGAPQRLYGETGAQTALVAALDAALGVDHRRGGPAGPAAAAAAGGGGGGNPGSSGSSGGSPGGSSSSSSSPSSSSWLAEYLAHQRAHMPPAHRRFLAALEARRGAVRNAVVRLSARRRGSGGGGGGGGGSGGPSSSSLVEAYDEALLQLERFRSQHRGFAKSYISEPSRRRAAGEEEREGTGGSDFVPALTQWRDTTAAARLQRQ
jgi:indoleamine 2,3-dioxygenase